MNRLLLEMHEIDARGRASLSDSRAIHIRQVLRGRPGMRLRAGLVNGPAGEVEILESIPPNVCVRFVPGGDLRALPAVPPPVDLLLALPRPKALKRLWPQLSALGVRRIVITGAERVERCYFSARCLAPEYVRLLLIEGAVQAGVTRLPEVDVHRHLSDALRADVSQTLPVSRWMGIASPDLTALPTVPKFDNGDVVRVAVGPEGGWMPAECDQLTDAGYQSVSLGPRILRSDTACVALLGLALHCTQSAVSSETHKGNREGLREVVM